MKRYLYRRVSLVFFPSVFVAALFVMICLTPMAEGATKETAVSAENVQESKATQKIIEDRRHPFVRYHGKKTGPELLQDGWREIARCEDGHQWSYILKKNVEKRLCKRINARAGPVEDACVSFKENLVPFKRMAAKAQRYVIRRKAAKKAGRLDEFLQEFIQGKESPPSCWTGFGQD